VSAVELHREVEELFNAYARALDDGPLEAWPKLFTPECMYLVMPRDNHDAGLPLAIMRCESSGMLEDRVHAVRETIMHEPRYLRHHITNVSITPSGDVIGIQANYSVIEVLPDELPKILSVGRYLGEVCRLADGLRFRELKVVYDSVLVPNTIVYPL